MKIKISLIFILITLTYSYFFSIYEISANRDEPIIAGKSYWWRNKDYQQIKFFNDVSLYVSKMPPKMSLHFGEHKVPLLLWPHQGPVSALVPKTFYELGRIKSDIFGIYFMRLSGIVTFIFLLIISVKFRLPTSFVLLLFSNFNIIFASSYIPLFWYAMQTLLIFWLYLLYKDEKRNYLKIFSISVAGTLTHLRFSFYSIILGLLLIPTGGNRIKFIFTLIGLIFGFIPYYTLSKVSRLNIDTSNPIEIFSVGTPGDIKNIIVRTILDFKFTDFVKQAIEGFLIFPESFLSYDIASELLILNNRTPEIFKILSFFIIFYSLFVGFSEAIRSKDKKSLLEPLYCTVCIVIIPFLNPSMLVFFTRVPWQFIPLVPFIYIQLAKREKLEAVIAINILQMAFIFFSFWNLRINIKNSSLSKEENAEMINFLYKNNTNFVINIAAPTSLDIESNGKIKSIMGIYELYLNYKDIVGGKIIKYLTQFDYVIISPEVEQLFKKEILYKYFEISYETRGKSLKLLKSKVSNYNIMNDQK